MLDWLVAAMGGLLGCSSSVLNCQQSLLTRCRCCGARRRSAQMSKG